ncbi:hypothetical protein SLEP1_g18655 [Rubroshorea leprosula]|uniref:BCNT-C domain-containing protein n=1 Tax=Rubroshorea leprosula TaxID=152421 RepID=A0AAV5J8T4_9ROSI|nr:hypothetical protein SLEP1_g18655 [Rubroshorea leprosula]
MATAKALDAPENLNEKDGLLNESVKDAIGLNSDSKTEDTEMKVRVEAMWEQMNKGISNETLRRFSSNSSSTMNKNAPKTKMTNNWMKYLQLRPSNTEGPLRMQDGTIDGAKKVDALSEDHGLNVNNKNSQRASNNWMANLGLSEKKTKADEGPSVAQSGIGEEAKRLAAAALSAVKDAATAGSNWGKIEITEVREFAGQEIEIKRRIDADAKEASGKAKASAPSAVDAVLDQIKKKPKLSVLDKTKKDWGEFKEENKGLEDELDAYKKSSNQYLDKVSFLERTDLREFERERDARLALHARRRPDMREEP